MRTAVALFLIPAAVLGQRQWPCEPSDAVRRALNANTHSTEFQIPWAARLKPALDLLSQYPRDIFVHHRYQDTFRHHLQISEERDRNLAIYRARPDDPLFRYLEARLMSNYHAKEAEQRLEKLIADEPSFVWPHLLIADMTNMSGFRDPAKAERHLRAFIHACPESPDGYALLGTTDNSELKSSGARKLRDLLEARRDRMTLPLWRNLWDLEFSTAGGNDRESARQRVIADAELLRPLALPPARGCHYLFRHAYELTKHAPLREWYESAVLDKYPDSEFAYYVTQDRFFRANPRPIRSASAEEHKAYAERERLARAEWQKRWPRASGVLWDQWMALERELKDAPLEQKLRISDEFAAMRRRSPDAGSSMPPLAYMLAERYVKWNARLDQVPGLVQQAARDAEVESKYQPHPSMIPEEIRRRGNDIDPVAYTRFLGALVLTDLYTVQQDFEKARDALATADLEVAGFAGTAAEPRPWVRFQMSQVLLRRAKLAAAERDTRKALSLYQQYLSSWPRESLQERLNDSAELKAIRSLYLANGGSEGGWLEWATARAKEAPLRPAAPALEFTKPLRDFTAKDLTGRSWTLADLRGKVTFVDVWATWCGPCRSEHPELEKFYEKIRDRKDIQLLTFSVDETAYLAESYMKEQKYTFPVIASKTLAESLFPMLGLPSGWIVDKNGRRSTVTRFSTAERTLAELERLARE